MDLEGDYFTKLLGNGPAGAQGFSGAGHEISEPFSYQGRLEQSAGRSDIGHDDFLAKPTSFETGQSQCSEVSLDLSDDGTAGPILRPTHTAQEEPTEDCITVAKSSEEWETAESTCGQKRKRRGATGVAPTRYAKRSAHIASTSQPQLGSRAPDEHPRSRTRTQETVADQSPWGSTRSSGAHRRHSPSVHRGRGPTQQAEVPSLPGLSPSIRPLARPTITQQKPASALRPQTAGSLRRNSSTSVFQTKKSDANCVRCGKSADMMLHDTTRAISSEAFHQHLDGLLDDKLPREELVRLVSRICCAFIHGHWLASRGSWTHSGPGNDLAFPDSAISLNPTGSSVGDSLSGATSGQSRLPREGSHSTPQEQQKGVKKWTSLEDMRLRAYRREGKDWEFICRQFPHRSKGALQVRAYTLGA